MPSSAWAPPGEARKPVMTSSKMRRVSVAVVRSRKKCRTEGSRGVVPQDQPVGSQMAAA